MTFKSIDTIDDENQIVNFSIEFLNFLDMPEMPPHNLRLKIGSQVILLRNWNPPKIMQRYMKIVIRRITGNVLEVTILTGKVK